MATVTVYAGTDDGVVQTFLGSASADSTATEHYMGVVNIKGTNDYSRYFTLFSNSIASSSTVTAVVYSMYGTADASTLDCTLKLWDSTWTTSLDTGDANAYATERASRSTSGWSTSGYNDWTSGASFPASINKGGEDRLAVVSEDTPTTNTDYRVQASSADTSGTTQDPKLTITYTVASFVQQIMRHFQIPSQTFRTGVF